MATIQTELAQIELPDFGHPHVQPQIAPAEYEKRLQTLWERAAERGLDALLVYADREHSANLAFLTGYDPRFEEALLILTAGGQPQLLIGNEGWGYSQTSPVKLERRLYQSFSLMGQDRSGSDKLGIILSKTGVYRGSKVGIIDWKYFGVEEYENPELWINAPAYLVDTVRHVADRSPVNATDLLMNPVNGMRLLNSVDQLASFEFAATCMSSSMRRILWGLKPGMSEFEAMELAHLNGMPLSCHPMLSTGPRAEWGLPSPSSRRMQVGDPFTCALGVWGALSSRAGFLVHDETQLPGGISDYVRRLVQPYFAAIVEWYQTVGLGVKGGELYRVIRSYLSDPFFGLSLNPGHFIHLDEWVHSPVYAGSNIELQAGMALQVDVIPATGGPYFTTNIEDGIALADEGMRQNFASRWPEGWQRIQARRAFMRDVLGIQLKPEVLPFSNLAACLPPYLLQPGKAMRVKG
jgi:hypothetical protein